MIQFYYIVDSPISSAQQDDVDAGIFVGDGSDCKCEDQSKTILKTRIGDTTHPDSVSGETKHTKQSLRDFRMLPENFDAWFLTDTDT